MINLGHHTVYAGDRILTAREVPVDGNWLLYLHFLSLYLKETYQMELTYLIINDEFYVKCKIDNNSDVLTLSEQQIRKDWREHGAKPLTQFINQHIMSSKTNAIPTKVKLDPGASLPVRAHDGDTGYDVKVRELYVVVKCQALIDAVRREEDPRLAYFRYGAIHTRKVKVTNREEIDALITTIDTFNNDTDGLRKYQITGLELRTGVHIQLPPGWGIQARACSRLGKTEYNLPFGLGTIDQPYTGDIRFIYHRRPGFGVCVSDIAMFLPGNTAGQFVLERVYDMDIQVVDELDETDRGAGGFGSTANKA